MLYKLTYQDGTTRKGEENETQWGRGVTHTAKGKKTQGAGRALCSDQVIHAYRSPEIAVLANGLHADIASPLCWSARGRVVAEDGLKVGCRTLTTLEIVPLPVLARPQRVMIAHKTMTEEKCAPWGPGGMRAQQVWEEPELGVAEAALRTCNERGFAERLTARIKRVIRETGNPIKPAMVFIDEVTDVPDSLWKKIGGE